jgi:type I restriction enzyme M protein
MSNFAELENKLWDAADELRANSRLKSSKYSVPVLGLIFLRYADHKFSVAEQELAGTSTGRRRISKTDYQARGVMYVPDEARFSFPQKLTEGENIGGKINDALTPLLLPDQFLVLRNPPPPPLTPAPRGCVLSALDSWRGGVFWWRRRGKGA